MSIKFTNQSKYDQLIFALEERSSSNIFGAFFLKMFLQKNALLAFSMSIAFFFLLLLFFLLSRITPEQQYVFTEFDVGESYQNGARYLKLGRKRTKIIV